MASSTFADIPPPVNERSSVNNTLIIIVNNDGTLSVDQETLHSLLAEQESSSTTAVRLVRLGVAPDDSCPDTSDSEESNSSHVNITVEGYYPPSMTQAFQHNADDIVDPFLGMDPEEMERLESALQSDQAKQILGEDVAAMLDILSVDDGSMSSSHLNDSIKMDHCYTNRQPAPPPASVASVASPATSVESFSVKGSGRPRKDYTVRNSRGGVLTSSSNLVMVKHIKTINPPLPQLSSSVVKKFTTVKSSVLGNEIGAGSVLKKNIPLTTVTPTPIGITEEMLNEKLQEIQHSADDYTNLSGDDLEEKSNSSMDQCIDVEVLQLVDSPGTKSSVGKSTAQRKSLDNVQLQQRTIPTVKPRGKLQTETTKKLQSKPSTMDLNNALLKAAELSSETASSHSQIIKKNYPKRENRKPPAHLMEVFDGPPLFSVMDVPRRVSLDSKSNEFRRDSEKMHADSVRPTTSLDSTFYEHSLQALEGDRVFAANEQDLVTVGAIKRVDGSRQSSTEGEGRRRSEEKPASLRGRSPRQSLDNSDVTDAESDLMMGENTEDDPHKLWCICKKPHNNRFMICCDSCEEWFHGKCVGVSKALGKTMEDEGNEWTCPKCKKKGRESSSKTHSKKQMKMTTFLSHVSKPPPTEKVEVFQQLVKQNITEKVATSSSNITGCIVCKKAARINSIYCSDACILKHAQDSKPSTAASSQLTGSKTSAGSKKHVPVVPAQSVSQSGIKAWLQANPSVKVIKTNLPNATSQGTVVVVKSPQIPVSKLKQSQLIAPKPISPIILKATNKPSLSVGADIGLKVTAAKSGSNTSYIVMPSERSQTGTKPASNSLLKEKSVANKADVRRQSHTDLVKKEEKKSATEPIRLNVRNTLHEHLLSRIQECEDLKSIADEKVKKMGLNIEEELYAHFRDTGAKYKAKYRSLIFNIKDAKNLTLFRKIAEKSITPYQLVRLTPEELASQELAEWRERESQHQLEMIKKNELDLMALSKTYVMKTHKGEQVIESEDGVKNDVPQLDNLESLVVSRQNSVTSTVSDQEGQDKSKEYEKDKSKRSSGKSSKSRKSKKDKKERRKDSKSHSRSSHKHHNKGHSERKKLLIADGIKDLEKSNEHERSKGSKTGGSVMDEISIKEVILGTMLEDSNADLEPTSTVTIKTPDINYSEDTSIETDATIVWKGVAEMPEVAKFLTTIHIVSGDSEQHCQSLSNKLDIVGRISPKLVWDHVSKMKKTDSYEIMVVRLAATTEAERIPYITLYSYLNSRSRLGVVGFKGIVGPVSPMIKDFYIMPLPKHSPLPQELLPLNGPGLEDDRPHLLLGILVARSSKKRMAPTTVNVGPSAAKISRSHDISDVPQITARSYTPPLPEEPLILSADTQSTATQQVSSDEGTDKHMDDLAAIKLRVSHLLKEDRDDPFSPGDAGSSEDLLVAPSNAEDLQRKMEELNRKIAEQKQEIENISSSFAGESEVVQDGNVMSSFMRERPIPSSNDDEAYSPSESITPPLQDTIPFLSGMQTSSSTSFIPNVSQDIALPSNLQEILANIKKHSDTKIDLKLDPIVQNYASILDEENENIQHSEQSTTYIPTEIKSSQEHTPTCSPQKSAPSTLSKLSDKELIEKAAAMERELEFESTPLETVKTVAPHSIKFPPVKYLPSLHTIDTDGLLNIPIPHGKNVQPKPLDDNFPSYICPPLPPPTNYPPPRYNVPPPGMYPLPAQPPPDYPAPPPPPSANVNYNPYPVTETGYGYEGNKRKNIGNDPNMQGHYLNSGKKSSH